MNAAEGGYATAGAGFRSVMLASSSRPGPGSGSPSADRWYSFPESMLRALLGEDEHPPGHPPALGPSSSARWRGPPPPSPSAVPIILLVPVTSAGPAGPAPGSAARPAALQVVAGPASAASALHRRASSTHSSVQASKDLLALPALPALPPTGLLADGQARDAEGLWSTHPRYPPSGSMSSSSADSDNSMILPLSLPSFGERTAAAKEMLSAAPGGPVRGKSSRSRLFTENSMDQSMLTRNQEVKMSHDSLLMITQKNDRFEFSRNKKLKKVSFCTFCKKNGETASTVFSHCLFKTVNGVDRIVCPQLRQIRCPICQSTGDFAHTISHCPEGKQKISVAAKLRRSFRRSDGSVRTSRI